MLFRFESRGKPRSPFLRVARWAGALCALVFGGATVRAEPPGVAYIFPAGAQRGTEVEVRVGGYYFHGDATLHMPGEGVHASARLEERETLSFHGPLILKPASQGREDYPKDYRAKVRVDARAGLGGRTWWCSTMQGVTAAMKFVIGDLPEITENEIEGPQDAVEVRLPLTINGRIFPREDADEWRFAAGAGQRISCGLAAREIGSPLQGALEVFGPEGLPVAGVEQGVARSGDPRISFVAPVAGTYRVRVRDAAFGGGQAHVYRLTVEPGGRLEAVFPAGGRAGEETRFWVFTQGTPSPAVCALRLPSGKGRHTVELPRENGSRAGVELDVSDAPEALRTPEGEWTGLIDGAAPFPGVLNGCISSPGETHAWRVRLEADTFFRAEVVASALGSRLDSTLALLDENGKELVKNDDVLDGRPDSVVQYHAVKGGDFTLRIGERFGRRAGRDFFYRLRLTRGSAGDFQLRIASEFFNAVRPGNAPSGAEAVAKAPAPKTPGLKLEVLGGNGKEIRFEVEGLPEGVEFEPKSIPAKAKSVELQFKPGPASKLGVTAVRVVGVQGDGETAMRRVAATADAWDAAPAVRLAITPRVPFKFAGEYWVTNDQPAGTSMKKTYRLEREGYEGPLRVQLSDKQIRCLQRLTARPVEVPPGADAFEFTVDYPTEVQLGWTSRVQLMVVGAVRDDNGIERPVSYTSADVNDQMISVVTAGLLGVQAERNSFRASPGVLEIPVRVRRHESLSHAAVRVGLIAPPHVLGVRAEEARVQPGQNEAVLRVHLDPGAGPFNVPLQIEAVTLPASAEEAAHTARFPVELL